MITAKLQGGLCNQLFIIAATEALAKRNGDEAVFNLDSCETSHQGNVASTYKDTIFKNLKTAPIDLSTFTTYNEPEFTYTPIPYSPNLNLSGYFQSWRYFSDCENYILELFCFLEDLKNNATEFIKALNSDKPITVCQVRMGDYVSNFSNVYYICGKEYFEAGMRLFSDNNFLFVSDDIGWCKENFKGDNIFYSPYRDDLQDLVLMSLCDNFIISNSTFGWWGSWFSSKENKKVVAPKNWFKESTGLSAKDLCCDDWIII